jgi:FMN hydrolase / 5-amino-6-(5-phospho-D-ribitylamino)uracil phosphatase
MQRMTPGSIRAICFDLDNTLWDVGPVLMRAEGILADWLRSRYPRIPERFTTEAMMELRAQLLRAEPHKAHDLTYLRRETLARMAAAVGYEHASVARGVPYSDVVPALERLGAHFRLASLSNGNADLTCIGLAHHFEARLHAAELGCAKPDPRAYKALADALTLEPAQILFVGDEPDADVRGPKAAGMRTAWVNRAGAEWPAEFSRADLVVPDLAVLATLLIDGPSEARS